MKPRFESSPFAKSLIRRMLARQPPAQRLLGPMFPHWTDGLHPSLRSGAEVVVREDRVLLHDHVRAINSSMVFAFNLFLSFRLGDPAPLAALLSTRLGRGVVVERVVFEYGGPTDVLAEVDGAQPRPDERFTASDLAVFVRDEAGRQGVVLIEVKLTESGFSRCNGATSPGNRRKDVCGSAEHLFANPSACYLRRPLRASRDRRYWPIFEAAHGSLRAAFPGCAPSGACPFRDDGQQMMRNHALLLGLQQAGIAQFGAFALVHHDGNPDVVGPWDRYVASVVTPNCLMRIKASELARTAPDPARTWVLDRYLLEEGP